MFLRSLRLGWVQLTLAAVFLLSVGLTGVAAAADGSAIPTATRNVSATDSLRFSPATLNIHVGDKVTWKNTGTVNVHTVTSNTNAWTSSPTLNPGNTFSVTFTTAGTYKYHCQFHSSLGMKGTIIVH